MDLVNKLAQRISEWLGPQGPYRFVLDCFGVEPTPQQRQLLEAVGSGKWHSIAVRSGHGTGKSASLSWLILWFLLTRPGAKVICTAPSRRQLFDILWAEIRLWLSRSVQWVRELLEVKSETINVVGRKDWFARACAINASSSPEEQAETLAGYHHKHLLCVVDEASGVPDPVFQPIEGYLTQPDNFVILAGNPTRNYGYFYEIFNDPQVGEGWLKLHWSSLDSPLVSQDWIRRMRRYGETSDTWRVRVLGEFPMTGSYEAIPWSFIEEAMFKDGEDPLEAAAYERNQLGRLDVWGLDVARFGNDETVLVKRCGRVVWDVATLRGADTVTVAEWVAMHFRRHVEETNRPPIICVDATGLGSGVVDGLRNLVPPASVLEVVVGWKSSFPELFGIVRHELWWRMRRAFEKRMLRIVPDEVLVRQLSSVRAIEDEMGRWKIESKKAMAKRGLDSPDRADALALTFWYDDPCEKDFVIGRFGYGNKRKGSEEGQRRRRYYTSWKTA